MQEILKLKHEQFPKALLEIPQPPKELYIRGVLPKENEYVFLAVVGSRNHTNYGRDICEKLIAGLRGYPIVIVSGLAMGIDTIAHRSAMKAGLLTLSMPGSGLDPKVLYPKNNINLAEEIVDRGGCLLAEFPPMMKAELYTFPQRNRLMAGISRATLVIEAAEKSGTLITARMALDYNRDVLVIPGSVFSNTSSGTNRLIRQGATPITNSTELLEALGFEVDKSMSEKDKYADCGPDEMKIIKLLDDPMERDDLVRASGMNIASANALLSIMEIKELICEELGEIRKI
ncbi:MAG: DNA-processing protein DprA [Candidatus Pacebacteria bacterium]|nr:DNA-processing protein DprA [Candidatus Paceibacterota bacterium]MBP9716190.1 DNA-processing protein DprA [Candidatus Paceibacterota bacterium]